MKKVLSVLLILLLLAYNLALASCGSGKDDKDSSNTPPVTGGSGEQDAFTYTREGDYIFMGEYPQTIKADNVTITDATDSRGYYLGSDGEYYAKVTASPYESTYTFSSEALIISGSVYYFKVEPIRWRILSEENGEALILCDSIIANMAYQPQYTTGNYYTTANGAPSETFVNNYKYSEVRAWLNAEFYEKAFSSVQQTIILTTEVDNSVASVGDSSNPYVCDNTDDKIFLLSHSEVANNAYGFSSDRDYLDVSRIMLTSDYSRATGAFISTASGYYGNGAWWLRSPSGVICTCAHFNNCDGSSNISNYVNLAIVGVVPALRITL